MSTPPAPSVLTALRGDANLRPRIDTGLAGGLREWLEDGLSVAAAASLPAGSLPLVVDCWAASGDTARATGSTSAPSVASLHRSMLRALFAQVVTTGQIDDPIADAVGALSITERGHSLITFYRDLPSGERGAFERVLRTEASILLARWPAVPGAWLPRVGDPVSFPLAGGRVVLRGLLDLVLGPPPQGRSSACVVALRHGERRSEHAQDRRFLALLETLRSGGPPFRVATYYTPTGEIDIDDVTEPMLAESVVRVLETTLPRCRALAA